MKLQGLIVDTQSRSWVGLGSEFLKEIRRCESVTRPLGCVAEETGRKEREMNKKQLINSWWQCKNKILVEFWSVFIFKFSVFDLSVPSSLGFQLHLRERGCWGGAMWCRPRKWIGVCWEKESSENWKQSKERMKARVLKVTIVYILNYLLRVI